MKLRDDAILAVCGLLLLLLTAGVLVREQNAEWRTYQQDFVRLAAEKLGPEAATAVESGIRQIWLPRLGVTDRCQTCHLGIAIPGLENERQPFATHPDLSFYKETHPFKDYGCTTCHQGQGYATRARDAHGEVQHWMTPMYTGKIAADYGLDSPGALIEMNCNQCHREDRETRNMPHINRAKNLLRTKNCNVCHIIKGQDLVIGPRRIKIESQTVGPDLSFEGAKYPEEFGFEGVTGKKSVLNWQREHLINPQQVSKDSLMINYVLTDEDSRNLALLLMSWKKKNIPVDALPSPHRSELTRPEVAKPAIAQAEALDGKTLYQEWLCVTCHGENGRSTTGAYPSLADQTLLYLVNQLKDIKSGVRASGNAGIMSPLTQHLTDGEIEAMSGYLHRPVE